jgi:ABC-type transport system involved in cytochrome bd biosynthesis fused ATPase/permease subunit
MPWVFLLLALVAFAIAFKTASLALAAVCLLLALGLLVAWALGLLAQKVGSRSRDESLLLDPQELRRLREQAEARRAQASTPPTEPPPV